MTEERCVKVAQKRSECWLERIDDLLVMSFITCLKMMLQLRLSVLHVPFTERQKRSEVSQTYFAPSYR